VKNNLVGMVFAKSLARSRQAGRMDLFSPNLVSQPGCPKIKSNNFIELSSPLSEVNVRKEAFGTVIRTLRSGETARSLPGIGVGRITYEDEWVNTTT
jgi:hypothetical protein